MNDKTITPKRAPSLIQLGRRGLFVLGMTALLLVAGWLWFSWNNLRIAHLQRLRVVASLGANQSQAYFDNLSSHLEALALKIKSGDTLHDRRRVEIFLNEFKARHPDLGGVTLILPDGQMMASTASASRAVLPNVKDNPEWHEDFNHNLAMDGLSINRPQHGYLLKTWLMPVRYTVRMPDSGVQFLIQTSVLLEKQQALWANLGLVPGTQIGLVREDGMLLSMWPLLNGKFDPGRGADKALTSALQANPATGFFHTDSPKSWIDERVGAYQRVRSYPVYTFLSVSNGVLFGMWWKMVQVPIFVLALLFIVGTLVYARLARRFADRMLKIKSVMALRLSQTALPSSGVREIDELCEALLSTQKSLQASAQNRERQLLSAADAGTYTVRMRDGTVVQANDAFLDMLGRSRGEVVGRPWAALFDQGDGTEGARSGLYPSQELSLRVLRFKHKQNRPLWLSLAEYVDDSDGELLRQGLAINVSEREELLAKVQIHSERLRTLWRLATERDTMETDRLRQMLRLGLDTLGMEVAMISQHVEGMLHVRYKVGTPILFEEGKAGPLTDSLCRETLRYQRSQFIEDLSTRHEYAASRLISDWQLRVYISAPIWVGNQLFGTLTFFDRRPHPQGFSEEDKVFVELLAAWFGKMLFEQQQRAVLETMAMTDSLTGLANRRAAEMHLNAELARARRAAEVFAVVICDLDRFKLINDHFGHDIGDQVLQHISKLMRHALREGDWVARWGGEEFIVFLHRSSGQEAYQAMERLRETIKTQPLETHHGVLELTASFGIGIYRGGDGDVTQILSEADGCLYEAKRRGRDRVMMLGAANRGLLWQAGMLQHALQEKRIVAAYQVMVDLKTRALVADEALARLIQMDGKILPAADFVEAAEGINLIHVVDDVIARSAIQRALGAGQASGQIVHFINLSPQFLARRDLLDTLLADVKRLAHEAGAPAGECPPIVFEITERQLLEDFSTMREDLKQLLDYGFRFALDDFGSGYSSFLYLAELPISFIKIEGWMVRNMQHNARIFSMVKSVVMLAKTLNMITIAECVEDETTAEMLRDMGVDWGQGFHFGRPQIHAAGTNAAAYSLT